jgi:acetyltransferase-like isoleucine patch superfamily enzyme
MSDEARRDLETRLVALYRQRDDELRRDFDRSLPFEDGMFDRWERAERLGFGAEASIYNSALVFGNVNVGEKTWVGPHVLLDGSGGRLDIGSHVSISAGVHIYTHDTVRWSLSLGELEREVAAVSIGDGCHIGAQAVIAAGAQIGDRSVIGANSFVKGLIPSHAVAAGSPAVVVGAVIIDGAEVTFDYSAEAVRSVVDQDV